MRIPIAIVVFLALGTSSFTQAPQAPQARQAPQAPSPGSPATYKSAEALAAALKIAKPTEGGMTTSNVATTDQYGINIVHRAKPAGAVAHAGNTELHYIIEGSGTVVTGGTIVRPPAGSTALATIENGVTRHVSKGDVIIVPNGVPHWFKEVNGAFLYYTIKVR